MLVIDTETGGLDPARCALVSVAAVHAESGAEFSLLIKPHAGLELEPQAMAVHGYSQEHLEEYGMDEAVAMQVFSCWLHVFDRGEWAGCNPNFDRGFLDVAFARHGIEKRMGRRPIEVQTVAWLAHQLGKVVLPLGRDGMPKRSLDAILQALGISRATDRHDALEDCRLTLAAFKQLTSLLEGNN